MNTGRTLFAQLMDFPAKNTFSCIVGRYGSDRRVLPLLCTKLYRA